MSTSGAGRKIDATAVAVGDVIATWSRFGAGSTRYVVEAIETFLDGRAIRFVHGGDELIVEATAAVVLIERPVEDAELEDADVYACHCGNTVDSAGFDAVDELGLVVEPTRAAGWVDRYGCRECGRAHRFVDTRAARAAAAVDRLKRGTE